jgi:hypothetical protein
MGIISKVFGVAAATALLVGGVAATAEAAPAQVQSEGCRNIGNGDLCIRVERTSGDYGKVTAWYHKLVGSDVRVRLGYQDSLNDNQLDEGSFIIRAGDNRGYIWYDAWLPTNHCYAAELWTVSDPATHSNADIYGGIACL